MKRSKAPSGAGLRGGLGLGFAVALGLLGSYAHRAKGQSFDPRRPRTVVVGAPRGDAPMARVDARRSGQSRVSLPTRRLRIAWRKSTGAALEGAPLVGQDGAITVVGARGDVVVLDPEGEERGRAQTGSPNPGPPVLTAESTVVFVSASGDVVGFRGNVRRFVTKLGGERGAGGKIAPLPLDDGGLVVGFGMELIILDGDGAVRMRALAPEPLVGALAASGGRILAVTRGGAVFGWVPGREVIRIGSFGAPIDGGLVVENGRTLLAVTEVSQLAELDSSRGGTAARSIAAPSSLYLGPVALGPRSVVLLGTTAGVSYLVLVDPSGQETRVAVGVAPPASPVTLLPDGGVPAVVVPPHVGPLVDGEGTIAFAMPEGQVGTYSQATGVSVIGESPCGRPLGKSPGIAGLAPAGKGAFVVACESGVVAKIVGE